MRLGVLDIGSNTVHLLVVDAHPGAQPLPAYSHKVSLRLAEFLEDGRIGAAGAAALADSIQAALQVAEDQGVQNVIAFATSAIREADNGEQVLGRPAPADRRAAAGAVRPGRGPAHLPRRTPLVRLVERAPAGAGHRRRLAGDRGRSRRGARRRAEPAAGRRPADPRAPAGRPAERRAPSGPCAGTSGSRSAPSCAASSRPVRRTASSGRRRPCARWPGSPGRRRPRTASTPRASCAPPTSRTWSTGWPG